MMQVISGQDNVRSKKNLKRNGHDLNYQPEKWRLTCNLTLQMHVIFGQQNVIPKRAKKIQLFFHIDLWLIFLQIVIYLARHLFQRAVGRSS